MSKTETPPPPLPPPADRLKEQLDAIEVEKARIELRKAQLDQLKAEIGLATPDLDKASKLETAIKGQLLGSTLALEAVRDASEKLANAISDKVKGKTVLLTDGLVAYQLMGQQRDSVNRAVLSLETRATTVLSALPAQGAAEPNARLEMAVGSLLSFAGSVLPVAMSLMNVKHILESGPLTITAEVAIPSVAHSLLAKAVKVILPALPVVSAGKLHDRLITLETSTRKALTTKLFALQEQLAGETNAAKMKFLEFQITAVSDVIAGIDAITTVSTVNPAGIALREAAIRAEVSFSKSDLYVLVLTAQSGSTDQLLSDRPLWSNDHLGVLAHATLSYLVIEHRTGDLVAAGSATGCVSAHATLGSSDLKVKMGRHDTSEQSTRRSAK